MSIICITQTCFWSYILWRIIIEQDIPLNNEEYRAGIMLSLFFIILSIIILISKVVKLKRRRKAQQEYLIQHSIVANMTGIEYERYCGEKVLTLKEVKRIEYTPPSNDYGADIIAYFEDGTKGVIQCKRYNGKVNNTAVQEVVAALAHYKADTAYILTNSTLTENARILAKENGVYVIGNFK